MGTKLRTPLNALSLVSAGIAASAWGMPAAAQDKPEPLIIQEQGSFAVGGTVITHPGIYDPLKQGAEGQTFHGDHAYVSYQIPVGARRLPLVLWHGYGQFSKTWETTPDGREGYQNIFLRRRFGVYLIDQPRRGRAGRSTLPMTITPTHDEQTWFGVFRLGIWPSFFPGVQFSRDPEALNQYFRQMVPNTGPFDLELTGAAVAALFDKIGPGILVTHSHSGGPGWRTAIKSRNVRAIAAYEPGSNFVFPNGEAPAPMPSSAGPLEALGVPVSEFMELTKIPIVIYYGDNIPETPVANPGQDQWRVRLAMARLWADAVNRRGGDVTVVHLPALGIRGNTHFPFSDLNNLQIADLLSAYLKQKGLDKAIEWTEKVSDREHGAPAAGGGEPTPAQRLIGDFSPKLVELTDQVLFGDVWARPQLSPRDRSLVTVSALIAMNRPDQLRSHLARARDNGVTEDELVETITHLAFYAGWPSAITAVSVAKEVFQRK